MQLLILLGRRLRLRLPERHDEEPSPRLRVRGHLQVWPGLFLQEVVTAGIAPRIVPVRGAASNKGATRADSDNAICIHRTKRGLAVNVRRVIGRAARGSHCSKLGCADRVSRWDADLRRFPSAGQDRLGCGRPIRLVFVVDAKQCDRSSRFRFRGCQSSVHRFKSTLTYTEGGLRKCLKRLSSAAIGYFSEEKGQFLPSGWCGRRDLNPHSPCGKTDFRTRLRLSPPLLSAAGFGVWTIPSPSPGRLRVSGAARLVSTPSRPFRAGLGSGSPCYRVPRI